MLTFNFHIGDFAKKTSTLTAVEKGIYLNLLMRYYDTEKPLMPSQCERIANARTNEEKAALDFVISEFFFIKKGMLHNKKADEEIAKYKEKSIKAKASASKRWDANAMRTHSERNAKAMLTTNHKPQTNIRERAPKKIKVCLPEDFVCSDEQLTFAFANKLNIENEFSQFSDYHKSRGNKFVDWHSAFNNWLRKAIDFKKEGTTYAERDRANAEDRARQDYSRINASDF